MGFITFTASTTAYAEQVMDNFYFIYQGDRLPKNSNFSLTADTYNIGSSSQRWRKVYANLIEFTAITTTTNFMYSFFNTSTSDATTTAIDITFPNTLKNYGFYCYAEFMGDFTTTIDFINTTFNSITTATYTSSYSNISSDYSAENTTGGFDIGIPLKLVSSATSDTTSSIYIRMTGKIDIYEGEEPKFEAHSTVYGVSVGVLANSIYSRFISGFLNDTSTITTMNMQFHSTIQNYKIAVWRLD